jgi:hypothetical protein
MHYLISSAILLVIALFVWLTRSPMSLESTFTVWLSLFGAGLGIVMYALNRRRENRHVLPKLF